MATTFVNWGESLVKLTWEPGEHLPPGDLITSVHGFCFYDDKLLLVNLNDRGWDMPGGHIEAEETAEQCFKRETMEEAYVTGDCKLLGSIIVDHSENSHWDKESKYPLVGYQVFYFMNIKQIHDFKAEFEAADRIFIEMSQVRQFYHDWHELYEEILTCAAENITKLS